MNDFLHNIFQNIEKIYYFLAIGGVLVAIVGLPILWWYADETYQLRVTAQKQYDKSVRPVIGLASPSPMILRAENASNNAALNVLSFSKWKNDIITLDSDNNIVGIVGPNKHIDFNFGDKNKNKKMDKEEFCKIYPHLTLLMQYMFNKKEDILSCVTYNDILGNQLYTLISGKLDTFNDNDGNILETGYVKDLENK